MSNSRSGVLLFLLTLGDQRTVSESGPQTTVKGIVNSQSTYKKANDLLQAQYPEEDFASAYLLRTKSSVRRPGDVWFLLTIALAHFCGAALVFCLFLSWRCWRQRGTDCLLVDQIAEKETDQR